MNKSEMKIGKKSLPTEFQHGFAGKNCSRGTDVCPRCALLTWRADTYIATDWPIVRPTRRTYCRCCVLYARLKYLNNVSLICFAYVG